MVVICETEFTVLNYFEENNGNKNDSENFIFLNASLFVARWSQIVGVEICVRNGRANWVDPSRLLKYAVQRTSGRSDVRVSRYR